VLKQLKEYDPIRTMLPVGVPCVILLVIGPIFPLVTGIILLLLFGIAAIAVGFFLARFVQKFVRENSGPRGIFQAWRPSMVLGLLTALRVLVAWSPFGFLSILVFGANGLIVMWLAELLMTGIDVLGCTTSSAAEQSSALAEFWPIKLLGLSELATSAAAELQGFNGFLKNLLLVIRYLLVLEGYVAWVFMIWLTTRSVLYFLARTVLSEQIAPAHRDAETPPIEARFDMEFMR
jgi:hypothetical protein